MALCCLSNTELSLSSEEWINPNFLTGSAGHDDDAVEMQRVHHAKVIGSLRSTESPAAAAGTQYIPSDLCTI